MKIIEYIIYSWKNYEYVFITLQYEIYFLCGSLSNFESYFVLAKYQLMMPKLLFCCIILKWGKIYEKRFRLNILQNLKNETFKRLAKSWWSVVSGYLLKLVFSFFFLLCRFCRGGPKVSNSFLSFYRVSGAIRNN